jgi:large subunit ribosomal protein L31
MSCPVPALSGWSQWSGTLDDGSGSRCRTRGGDPATMRMETDSMKSGIHPDYVVTEVTCTCGNTFTTRSTAKNGVIHADVCSNCHPFYTGKQKIMDTGGRVARFQQRYGKKTADK